MGGTLKLGLEVQRLPNLVFSALKDISYPYVNFRGQFGFSGFPGIAVHILDVVIDVLAIQLGDREPIGDS